MHFQKDREKTISHDNRKYLEEQIKEKRMKDHSEKKRLKEKMKTNYGPEESEYAVMMEMEDRRTQRLQLEKELQRQMDIKKTE